jgi:hypothetical protein
MNWSLNRRQGTLRGRRRSSCQNGIDSLSIIRSMCFFDLNEIPEESKKCPFKNPLSRAIEPGKWEPPLPSLIWLTGRTPPPLLPYTH